jgi:hypothetical protein
LGGCLKTGVCRVCAFLGEHSLRNLEGVKEMNSPSNQTATHSGDNAKRLAWLRIIRVCATKSATMLVHASILGAIALATGMTLPPPLQFIAGGVGVNLISSLLDRLVWGENLSDSEMLQFVQKAIDASEITKSLKSNDFQRALGRLLRRLDLIQYALKNNEISVARQLTEQFEKHETLFKELRSDMGV